MQDCPQGIHAFLRAYYHYKVPTWKLNTPFPFEIVGGGRIGEDAEVLHHGLGYGMAETVWRNRRRRMPKYPHAPGCPMMSCGFTARNSRARHFREAAMVPQRDRPARRRAAAGVFKPQHRCAVLLHRRKKRLGHVSKSRCVGRDGRIGLYPVFAHSLHRGRRPLGTTGTTRRGE